MVVMLIYNPKLKSGINIQMDRRLKYIFLKFVLLNKGSYIRDYKI